MPKAAAGCFRQHAAAKFLAPRRKQCSLLILGGIVNDYRDISRYGISPHIITAIYSAEIPAIFAALERHEPEVDARPTMPMTNAE